MSLTQCIDLMVGKPKYNKKKLVNNNEKFATNLCECEDVHFQIKIVYWIYLWIKKVIKNMHSQIRHKLVWMWRCSFSNKNSILDLSLNKKSHKKYAFTNL